MYDTEEWNNSLQQHIFGKTLLSLSFALSVLLSLRVLLTCMNTVQSGFYS